MALGPPLRLLLQLGTGELLRLEPAHPLIEPPGVKAVDVVGVAYTQFQGGGGAAEFFRYLTIPLM